MYGAEYLQKLHDKRSWRFGQVVAILTPLTHTAIITPSVSDAYYFGFNSTQMLKPKSTLFR